MFLKVSNGNGEWILFDNVDRIDFGITKKSILNREELEIYDKEGHINLISKSCFPRETPLDIGFIEFHRNGVLLTALFTSVAYVLNNSGDTIEKISALNLKERKNG